MMDSDEARPPSGRRFVLGADHAGYEMKEALREYLAEGGNEIVDLVPEFQGRTDFPPIAEQVACRIASGQEGAFGILVCGTGIGMSIAANKVPGIRAALLYDPEAAEYARRHNDANVLVFGGRTMEFGRVRACLDAFFGAEFEGGRYAERNRYISGMERGCKC